MGIDKMHQFNIPESVHRAVIARRHKFHVYDTVVGESTALIVIDLQNYFMLPGMAAEMPIAREIVPNVNRLARATRDAGGKVVWVQMSCTDAERSKWTPYFDGMSPERQRAVVENLTPGTHGYKLFAALDVESDDEIVEKNRISVFIQGSSGLDAILRSAGIDTVLITGTMTNTCCDSSARDATMLNYKTIMIADANATRNDEEHNAELIAFLQGYGDVYTTDEAISLLKSRKQGRPQNRAAGTK
jgi:ureidoacrylate peracid hydrolase